MRFDRDTFREITDTITRNKSRSLLTGFGVFWGIFMLLVLVGGGNGLHQILNKTFDGFATNMGGIFPSNTSKEYKGFKKDRDWDLEFSDVNRLKSNISELDVVVPLVSKSGKNALYGEYSASCSVKGITPEYYSIETPLMYYGRSINDMDINQERKVCVLGKKIYKKLFPDGGDPCGKKVSLDGIYYSIVGVDYRKGSISINGSADETVSIPLSLAMSAYNMGNRVESIMFTAHSGIPLKTVEPKIRGVLSRAHFFDPTDTKAMFFLNAEMMFGMMESLFKGINILLWIVGLGTILAGAIGVSNIMMVTVRERTTEIGIRRAIGATPKMILSQIISESILLTILAGFSGIVFSVFVLNMADKLAVQDGVRMATFQVSFWMAIVCALMLTLLGVLAGLAPASRAMAIKPVDAMRDE